MPLSGTLLAGLGILATWYALTEVFGSLEEVALAIDVNDDTGITKPGWYFTAESGLANKCGDDRKFMTADGAEQDCSYEFGVTGLLKNTLNSEEVSDAFDKYVGFLLYVAFGYGGAFLLFMVAGCCCINKRR
jgi:hypothetical protein